MGPDDLVPDHAPRHVAIPTRLAQSQAIIDSGGGDGGASAAIPKRSTSPLGLGMLAPARNASVLPTIPDRPADPVHREHFLRTSVRKAVNPGFARCHHLHFYFFHK